MVDHKIYSYRVFISHEYDRAEEYLRLVRMLDRYSERDPTWRWSNMSVPTDARIMTEDQAQMGDVYVDFMKEHLQKAHVILFILRDVWIEVSGSIYLELIEASQPRYRPQLPVINILPRGDDFDSLKNSPISNIVVNWNARSIVQAIREHAIPASAEELVLTTEEIIERKRIIKTLEKHSGHLERTATDLGYSKSTLRRKRIDYLIY